MFLQEKNRNVYDNKITKLRVISENLVIKL